MGCNCPLKIGINPTNVVGGYPTNPAQGIRNGQNDQELSLSWG